MLLGTVLAPDCAFAHPHVFISNLITFVFADGKVTGMRLQWTFDEVFSETVIGDFDRDGNGSFDAAETASVEKDAFGNLRDYHYFTYLWLDGVPVEPVTTADFRVRRENDMVIYSFLVPLPAAVDPAAMKLEAAVYDAEYYVEVLLERPDPVRFEGNEGLACSAEVREDEASPYYFDSIYPERISLSCSRTGAGG